MSSITLRRLRGRWWWLLVGLAVAAPGWAEAAKPELWVALNSTRQSAQKLRAEGKRQEAIRVCEAFMQQYPAASGHLEAVVGLLRDIFDQDMKDRDEKRTWCERVLADFQHVPQYYATGAGNLIGLLLASGSAEERSKVAALAQTAIDQLGPRLPVQFYSGLYLVARQVQALRVTGQPKEALAAARAAAAKAPLLLSNWLFVDEVYQSAVAAGTPDEIVAAAKLEFVLCDYTPGSVDRAVKAVVDALQRRDGPGVARQFQQAQLTHGADNPLRPGPLLELGDAGAMYVAAASSPAAMINVALYEGNLVQALEAAKKQLREVPQGDSLKLNNALRDLARCFKANDLDLLRANQFLEFHRTGQGTNPLADLERELAGTGKAR